MTNISDDTSQLAPIFNELKQNFLLDVTSDLAFREKELEKLISGYTAMIP